LCSRQSWRVPSASAGSPDRQVHHELHFYDSLALSASVGSSTIRQAEEEGICSLVSGNDTWRTLGRCASETEINILGKAVTICIAELRRRPSLRSTPQSHLQSDLRQTTSCLQAGVAQVVCGRCVPEHQLSRVQASVWLVLERLFDTFLGKAPS
jgi:hypothetical protein